MRLPWLPVHGDRGTDRDLKWTAKDEGGWETISTDGYAREKETVEIRVEAASDLESLDARHRNQRWCELQYRSITGNVGSHRSSFWDFCMVLNGLLFAITSALIKFVGSLPPERHQPPCRRRTHRATAGLPHKSTGLETCS